MYTLHIANKNYSSWSLRPWVLMKELGIPFEEQLHPFGNHDYSNFAPNAKVPCLHDADFVVWDSLAIVEYLAEFNAKVWPSDIGARAWARSATAEMHSGFSSLRECCGMNVALRVKLHEIPKGLLTDISRLSGLWSEGLEKFGGPFLAGNEFTAVDAFFAPVVFRHQTYNFALGASQLSYCERMLDLESMQLWQRQALAEQWVDANHEDDIQKYGQVVHDFRIKPSS